MECKGKLISDCSVFERPTSGNNYILQKEFKIDLIMHIQFNWFRKYSSIEQCNFLKPTTFFKYAYKLLPSKLGQVSIEFYVEKEMNFVVLHAENLNITEKVS